MKLADKIFKLIPAGISVIRTAALSCLCVTIGGVSLASGTGARGARPVKAGPFDRGLG